MELGTVLGVWAHPDDETYLSAGLMAQAVRDGDRVVCITATRGEGGSLDEERWPPETMGAVREAELMRCLQILGVSEHVWLDLPDIDMDTPLPSDGYARVLELMDEVQPDTVLTFGPDGMTGHAAHMSACAWATQAFETAAPEGAKLFYATNTEEWAAEFVPDLQPVRHLPARHAPRSHRVTSSGSTSRCRPTILELKLQAIEAHESQVGGMVDAFGEDIFRRAMKDEYYTLADDEGARGVTFRSTPRGPRSRLGSRTRSRVRGSDRRPVGGAPQAAAGSADLASLDRAHGSGGRDAAGPRRADVRRRALRLPARRRLRVVGLPGTPGVHGVRRAGRARCPARLRTSWRRAST